MVSREYCRLSEIGRRGKRQGISYGKGRRKNERQLVIYVRVMGF